MRRPYLYTLPEVMVIPPQKGTVLALSFDDKTVETFDVDDFAIAPASNISTNSIKIMDIRIDGLSLIKHAKQRRSWSTYKGERRAEYIDVRSAGRRARLEFWIENNSGSLAKLRLTLLGQAVPRVN